MSPRRQRSRIPVAGRFRRRLTVAFVLVAAMSAAALAIGSYAWIYNARLGESLQRAASDARFQLVVAREFLPLDDERTIRLLDSFEETGRHVVLVRDSRAVPSHPGFDPPLGPQVRSLAVSGQIAFERLTDQGRHLLVVGGRIPGSTAVLFIVSNEDGMHADLLQLATALIAGWVAVVLVAGLVGTVIARRTLDPVARASLAARALAEGLLDTRLPATGRDEFGAWAGSFNQMAEALAAKIAALGVAEERERRFTADVAHELRTPLTALVVEASLLRDMLAQLPEEARRPATLLVDDVMRLRRLVDELMEISRLTSGGADVRVGEVDPRDLADAVVRSRGWEGQVRVDGTGFRMRTDARRFERIIANLVGNAVEHGAAAGHPVVVEVAQADGRLRLTVTDRGPGIEPRHLPHVFDRFYKADSARSSGGSGLGLAIARENVRLLGGEITVTSRPGTGTQFRVDLPAAPAAPAAQTLIVRAATELLRDGEAPDERQADRDPRNHPRRVP